METDLKEFLVSRGATKKTLDCLVKEEIVSMEFFSQLMPKHFDHLLSSNKVSLGQHIILTGLSCTENLIG